MTRLFEMRSHEVDGELLMIIDLDKVCMVRLEKQTGHHYPQILVRFVDGHEAQTMVPPEAAQRFVDAYRAYLRSATSPPEGPGAGLGPVTGL